jgi:hypothetical protein
MDILSLQSTFIPDGFLSKNLKLRYLQLYDRTVLQSDLQLFFIMVCKTLSRYNECALIFSEFGNLGLFHEMDFHSNENVYCDHVVCNNGYQHFV